MMPEPLTISEFANLIFHDHMAFADTGCRHRTTVTKRKGLNRSGAGNGFVGFLAEAFQVWRGFIGSMGIGTNELGIRWLCKGHRPGLPGG